MIEAVKIWNEPNNLSHWDFTIDPEWRLFGVMASLAADAIRQAAPETTIVLGGISPIDPMFMSLLKSYGLIDKMDAVGVHGFPLDWNHWRIEEWPDKISEIEDATGKPVWVTEAGVSSFGADEVQVFGLERTAELLLSRVERVYWYSLYDLPPAWEATTRHKESEGSAYYRHYYMGLVRADGTPKPALERFDPAMGVAQWFHWQDHRLDEAAALLKRMGVRRLRTGISWADWHRPAAQAWFDRQMEALADFDVVITLCFTPPSCGRLPHHTSPPVDLEEFGRFAREVVERYVLPERVLNVQGQGF